MKAIRSIVLLAVLFLQTADSGIYQTIWENNININPTNLYYASDIPKAISRLRTENYIHIGVMMYLSKLMEEPNTCDLTIADERFFQSTLGFPIGKDFQYLEIFNKGYCVFHLFV